MVFISIESTRDIVKKYEIICNNRENRIRKYNNRKQLQLKKNKVFIVIFLSC